MQEINMPKFRALGLTEMIEKKDGGQKERIVDWSKRNDHRHHAMDALTIAFTKHNHIQYLNYLNARKNENHKLHGNIIAIEAKETELTQDDLGNRKRKFKLPMPNFREVVKEHLETILVSHKAKNKVVTRNKNKIKGAEKPQKTLTPRGQLHKETIYGKYSYYECKEEKIGTKFDEATIRKVANPQYKSLLSNRLLANNNDPKKAFSGKNALSKNPVYLNGAKHKVMPEKIKLAWLETDYSTRKDVTPENFKDIKTIEKVLDVAIKNILLKRLADFGNDPKKAFSDLGKNPIWLNETKGIAIKRVTLSGIKNAEPLHYQKDHFGKEIKDGDGNLLPADFVSTGNNHHVAIYIDADGNLQDKIVTLFDAVRLSNAGEPVIDRTYNQGLGWKLLFTMKQNEMFVFPNEKTGFNPKEIDLLDPENKRLISPNLFRVQKLSRVEYGNSVVREYVFRHHFETSVEERKELKEVVFKNIKSLGYFGPVVKVRVNHIGQIVSVGEY
jgi:CRISPR-associated endonuclease Csn1